MMSGYNGIEGKKRERELRYVEVKIRGNNIAFGDPVAGALQALNANQASFSCAAAHW